MKLRLRVLTHGQSTREKNEKSILQNNIDQILRTGTASLFLWSCFYTPENINDQNANRQCFETNSGTQQTFQKKLAQPLWFVSETQNERKEKKPNLIRFP